MKTRADIDVGGDRVWSYGEQCGWVEIYRWGDARDATHASIALDPEARALRPAEVERAERGLGPVAERPIAEMGREDIRAELGAMWSTEGCDKPIIEKSLDQVERGGSVLLGDVSTARERALADALFERAERGEGPETSGTVDVYVAPATECDAAKAAVDRLVAGPMATTWLELAPGQTAIVFTNAPPAGLAPEQAARYQDATAATLRRLVAEYADLAAESSVTYYASGQADKSSLLDALTAARVAQEQVYQARSMYVAYGTGPDTFLRTQAAWRIVSECDASRPSGVYLARVCDHAVAALRGESLPLPSTDDLGGAP